MRSNKLKQNRTKSREKKVWSNVSNYRKSTCQRRGLSPKRRIEIRINSIKNKISNYKLQPQIEKNRAVKKGSTNNNSKYFLKDYD